MNHLEQDAMRFSGCTAAELPAVMALVEDPAHDLSECSNQQLARWSVEALKDVRAS